MDNRNEARCRMRTIALLLLLTIACGGGDSQEPVGEPAAAPGRPGGTAVLGSISDVDHWNEYLSQQSFATKLLRRIYLRLATPQEDRADEPQTFESCLAESWELSDDQASLTFKLRDVEWSDGTPVTAEDVRFTWQAQTSPDIPWAGVGTKKHIEDVQVVDAKTVRFVFDQPYPYQLEDAVEGGILPAHTLRDLPFDRWATHDWSAERVGSGPFLLARHDAGREITLTRNPRYYEQGLPLLDRVVVKIVPDATNLVTQLMTGEIDFLEGISPQDAERLRLQDGLSLVTFDAPKYDFIGWNGARAPFDDPEVRRAMTLAIDRGSLVEDLLYGYGRVSKGPLLSFWWNANKELEPWPYSPDEARAILREAGYSVRAADGSRTDGEALRIELVTNTGNRLREQMLVKIQAQLEAIGVEVEVAALEMRTLRGKVGGGDYDGYLGGWEFDGKADLRQLFGTESVLPHGMNVVHYSSEEVDRLLAEADGAADWRTLKPTLDAVQDRIHDDQPYTFLYETKRIAGHSLRLEGVKVSVASDSLADLERYWID